MTFHISTPKTALAAVYCCIHLLGCGDDAGTKSGSLEDDAGAGGSAGSTGGASSGGAQAAGAGGTAAGGAATGGVASGGAATGGAGGAAAGGSAGTAGSGGVGPEGGTSVVFTDIERAILATLSPLPAAPPPDTTNAFADLPDAAVLGQMFFFDKAFSGPLKVASDLGAVGETGKISCATCHSGASMDDQRSLPSPVSVGADFHTRNAPTLINSAFYDWTNWGGRFSAQWELPLAVAESGVIMNGNRLQIVHRIFGTYRAEYEGVFGAMDPALADTVRFPAAGKPKPAAVPPNPPPADGAWEGMAPGDQAIVERVFVNYGKAIGAYVRLLVSRNAPFDLFVEGEDDAIGEDAKRGLRLFIGDARCINCHAGPHFADGQFHNIGIPQTGDHVPASDDGRFKDIPGLLGSRFSSATVYSDDQNTGRLLGLTNPPATETRGQFRTPGLRSVALTAPYMHSGQHASLADVIGHYKAGGAAPVSGELSNLILPFSAADGYESDLVAFMETLTGEPVAAALLLDTSKP